MDLLKTSGEWEQNRGTSLGRNLGAELLGILVGTRVEWEEQEFHPPIACPAGENPDMTLISQTTAATQDCHLTPKKSQTVTHLPSTCCHRLSFRRPSSSSLKGVKSLSKKSQQKVSAWLVM